MLVTTVYTRYVVCNQRILISNGRRNTKIILFLDADSRGGNNVVYLIIIIIKLLTTIYTYHI
jgi:hypothetical protein